MAKKPFSFAHLLGLGTSASEEDEDNKAKKAKSRKAEDDERDDDAEDDDERDDDAEDDGRDEDAEDDDGDDNDPDAEEDDGDDSKKKDGKAARQARASERKRCARIFGSTHAASNPALAASLAFNTGMSSASAINVLASSAPVAQPQAPRKRSLDQRMQENNVRLGPDGGNKTGGKSALVDRMTSLYNSTTTKGEK